MRQLLSFLLLAGLTLPGSAHAQQVITFSFAAKFGADAIPGSDNATFCALTGVNDDADPGLCRIFFQDGQWLYTTGSSGGGHSCTGVCVWVPGDESRRVAARLREAEEQVQDGNARIAELEDIVDRLQAQVDRLRDRLGPRRRSSRP